MTPQKLSNMQSIEKHPLGYFLPANTQLLMLGSFPPKKERWSMNFYYPNFQNDMWRILGLLFFGDKDYFVVDAKKAFDEGKTKTFCTEKGIGIGDTAVEVIRLKDNASDKFLEIVTPIDLKSVLNQIPECNAIVITGQKALETLMSIHPFPQPQIGGYTQTNFEGRTLKIYRMPSTSRAYPKPLVEKAADYRKMFEDLGMI